MGHFYGHPKRSAELARDILTRLHADRASTETICTLVLRHDEGAPVNRKVVRRWIGRLGPELLLQLLEVKRADCLAHADTPKSRARYAAVMDFTDLTRQVLAEERCFTVKDLAISGRDVLAAGAAPGPQVGQLLQALLEDVLEERCANEPQALQGRLRQYLHEKGQSDAD